MYSLIKATPVMIEIKNIVDYARNLALMMNDFYKLLPKKCIPMQIYKKVEMESI